MNPKLRTAIDFGPLIAFGLAFYLSDQNMFIATAAIMAATLIVLPIGYSIERKLAPMPLFTGVIVMFFGGLTLILKDPSFVMMKPTIVYGFFATILLGGLVRDKNFLEMVMGQQLELPHHAWRTLTFRMVGMFIFLAILNEIVRHNMTMDAWVKFKIFGATGIFFVFNLTQVPFIMKHMPQVEEDETDKGE